MRSNTVLSRLPRIMAGTVSRPTLIRFTGDDLCGFGRPNLLPVLPGKGGEHVDHVERRVRIARLEADCDGHRGLNVAFMLRRKIMDQYPLRPIDEGFPNEAVIIEKLPILGQQIEITAGRHQLALSLVAGESLELLHTRLAQDTATEFGLACGQVERIAALRLKDLLP